MGAKIALAVCLWLPRVAWGRVWGGTRPAKPMMSDGMIILRWYDSLQIGGVTSSVRIQDTRYNHRFAHKDNQFSVRQSSSNCQIINVNDYLLRLLSVCLFHSFISSKMTNNHCEWLLSVCSDTSVCVFFPLLHIFHTATLLIKLDELLKPKHYVMLD